MYIYISCSPYQLNCRINVSTTYSTYQLTYTSYVIYRVILNAACSVLFRISPIVHILCTMFVFTSYD